MGQVVKQDMAVSVNVMLAMLMILDKTWEDAPSMEEKSKCANVGAYISIAFCGSFRGAEVFLVDLYGLLKYADLRPADDGMSYVIVPLLGRFKSELGIAYHLTPLAAKTNSGINVKLWVKRLLAARKEEGRFHGPAFVGSDGNPLKSMDIEAEVLDLLARIQTGFSDLIPSEINVHEEYGISRSFRRGATSEARARGVPREDIDLANRWRNFEQAKGRRPRQNMRDHYSDIRLLIPALTRFSQSL